MNTHRCSKCGEEWWDAHVCNGAKIKDMLGLSAQFESEPLSRSIADIERAGLLMRDASTEIERLKAFAFDVMEALPDGGIDAGDLQEIAVKHGLLIQETRGEPCGENCACKDYGFPANCHRRVDWLLTPND